MQSSCIPGCNHELKNKMKEISLKRSDLFKIFETLGESKIRSILDQFYKEMSQDIIVGFFFDGKDLNHIAHQQHQFLLRAFGARDSYSGLPPSDAHHKLAPILAGHFDRRLILLKEVLQKNQVDEELIKTWLQFEEAFRNGIQSK